MKKIILLAVALAAASYLKAQESTAVPLSISGSADTYFKYDFAKTPNIATSFATDQNSVSLGMIDLALKKTSGKASFVGELSFGPRGQFQSVPNGDGTTANDGNSFHVQNLNLTYAFTDKFSLAAGYFGTFIGYEVISPAGNFNYSTSYLFTNGPFQNAGVKATYAFSPKAGLMVGLFNEWNTYKASRGVSSIGAQLMVSPAEGWTAYLNVLNGGDAYGGYGTVLDLTTSYQITGSFKLGLNATDFRRAGENGGFSGSALYIQQAFSPAFALGVRGEYFKSKSGASGLTLSGVAPDESVTAITVSGNLKAGGLTFIPEIRFDNGSATQFFKENGSATKSASQFSLAAVYAF
ncbi:outer membrane beta-barrel protein [Hufsiella ginkgonis]|uniref:Outer membrane beta-barrel protein n=1 Tax=Hufsiella ginkgonis TaxID=2695274 RepID=A0A7K1XSX0_9SPHI|nr:porin [Hufsiella ginkgonis]MXV14042.1 outer membrane beta-barrel protein [Hufsiella ginkgonis]